MSIVLVATIVPRAEFRTAVSEILERAVARVHVEDRGCELYALHEDTDRLVMIEKWTDSAALESHRSSEASRWLRSNLAGLLATEIEIVTLAPRPAGTKSQGAI